LLLREWYHPYEQNRAAAIVFVINRKGWPHTETITLKQGDSTQFRVINTIALHHPLFSHNFYYQIESKGDGTRDVVAPLRDRHLSHTDRVDPAHTVAFSLRSTQPEDWLFHCHFAFHADDDGTLSGSSRDSPATTTASMPAVSHDDEWRSRLGDAFNALTDCRQEGDARSYVRASHHGHCARNASVCPAACSPDCDGWPTRTHSCAQQARRADFDSLARPRDRKFSWMER